MGHYFGLQASVRPDVRLEVEDGDSRRELYLDAKHSTEPSYLGESHLKMLAYVADRPTAFGNVGPKVILVTPRKVTGAVRPDDAVVFVDPSGCGAAPLRDALATWLGPIGEQAAAIA